MMKVETFDTNLNYYIHVRLNERGVKIYENSFRKYNIEPSPLMRDKDGYVKFQMWDFMETFGPHLHTYPLVDLNVRVEREI